MHDSESMLPPPAPAATLAGHNRPPIEIADLIGDTDLVRADLLQQWHEPVVLRRDELLASASRFFENHEFIYDDEVQAKAGLLLRQMRAHVRIADGFHDAAKKPITALGKAVDGLWHEMVDPLNRDATAVEKKMLDYGKRMKLEAQRKADEEAAKRRQEAAALAAQANELAARTSAVAAAPVVNAAIHAQHRAAAADRAATNIDTAAATRVRTDGVTVSMGGRWTYEVTDKMALLKAIVAGEVSADAVMVAKPWADSQLSLKPEIKASNGDTQPIPGIRFYRDEKITAR